MTRWRAALLLLGLIPAAARADDTLSTSDAWRVRSNGALTVDGGLLLASPTALGTGLSSGVGIGITRGRTIAWQVHASWSTATESSIPWTTTHDDVRLRAGAVLQKALGRARVGVRLGLGPTAVHESRSRNQGMRAGLTGNDLQNSATALFGAADLEAVLSLHVFGQWLLVLGGGPSVALGSSGSAHAGAVAQLGIGWQP